MHSLFDSKESAVGRRAGRSFWSEERGRPTFPAAGEPSRGPPPPPRAVLARPPVLLPEVAAGSASSRFPENPLP